MFGFFFFSLAKDRTMLCKFVLTVYGITGVFGVLNSFQSKALKLQQEVTEPLGNFPHGFDCKFRCEIEIAKAGETQDMKGL